ncbi:MAG: ATP phosphoribosyltransferase regulatory subunit [Alphaproteobacteria bacterium]|nr:ATP phosphoribosyltransferase regulatory subunit [Alphaproteobacteria bacterium]
MNDLPDKALLPIGMEDGLPPQAAEEARLAERLVYEFGTWGYGRVKPPLMEFEENLLFGNGAAMATQTFRVQDPLSQRMLALRPDMTLQVARIARSRLSRSPRPLRLAYAGQVARTKGSPLRPERQFGQVGAELIGAGGPAADVEVILMVAESLGRAGVRNVSIDLGLPTLAGAVTDGCDLDDAQRRRLRAALDHKDRAAVAAMSGVLGETAARALDVMLESVGPAREGLEKLAALDLGGDAAQQRVHLARVMDGVEAGAPDLSITLDPVETRGFEYHTGVTFAVFAQGVMGELGRGGRYSAGEGEEATGLTLFMDMVMQAAPKSEQPKTVFLPWGVTAAKARELRGEGWRTVSALEHTDDAQAEARRLNCGYVLVDGAIRQLD